MAQDLLFLILFHTQLLHHYTLNHPQTHPLYKTSPPFTAENSPPTHDPTTSVTPTPPTLSPPSPCFRPDPIRGCTLPRVTVSARTLFQVARSPWSLFLPGPYSGLHLAAGHCSRTDPIGGCTLTRVTVPARTLFGVAPAPRTAVRMVMLG